MIVVDANVVLGALRSRNGASHVVLRGLPARRIPFVLSPAMVLEYEDVPKRPGLPGPDPWIDEAGIDAILDALCAIAVLTHDRQVRKPGLSAFGLQAMSPQAYPTR